MVPYRRAWNGPNFAHIYMWAFLLTNYSIYAIIVVNSMKHVSKGKQMAIKTKRIIHKDIIEFFNQKEYEHNSQFIRNIKKFKEVYKEIPNKFKRFLYERKTSSGSFANVYVTPRFAYKIAINDEIYNETLKIFCKNQNNKFYPKIYDAFILEIYENWEDMREGNVGLFITFVKMEKLFGLPNNALTDAFISFLDTYANDVINGHVAFRWFEYVDVHLLDFFNAVKELILDLKGEIASSENKFNSTILNIDAHEKNIMMRKDASFVITDLFV